MPREAPPLASPPHTPHCVRSAHTAADTHCTPTDTRRDTTMLLLRHRVSAACARRILASTRSPSSARGASGSRCQSAVPARLGDTLDTLDTPALLVDLDAFEQNCLKLKEEMGAFPSVTIRPHAKAHKCPQLARLQLQLLGPLATGVCCQKVSEAEAMVAGGILDVLVSNEVVAHAKLRRLVALAAQGARVSVVVDAAGPLEQLAAAAAAWGVSINVLVEVNAGQDRCGVDTPEAAARLAERTAELSQQLNGAVSFAGIQAYHGGLQHVRDPSNRASAVAKVVDRAATAVAAVRDKAGLECGVVTGGGSGTWRLEAASGVFTELQPGSFAFGDADYARNIQADGQAGEWEQSLWVLAQVMSVSQGRGCAVLDAGLKAVSLDSGPPLLLEHPQVAAGLLPPSGATMAFEGVEFESGGDEHGKLVWPMSGGAWQAGPPQLPGLGQKLLLQPGHCDPTVNLFDDVVAVRFAAQADGSRRGVVVGVWPVAARGPGS